MILSIQVPLSCVHQRWNGRTHRASGLQPERYNGHHDGVPYRIGVHQRCILRKIHIWRMQTLIYFQGMPYAIAKNIRDNIPKRCNIHCHKTNSYSLWITRDAHLAQIGAILKRDPFTLDVSFETMKPHMEKDGHPLARYVHHHKTRMNTLT